jgi:hypothetical protein
MVALAIIVSPVALFGLMHKTKLHFVGIEYSLPDGKKGGYCFRLTKTITGACSRRFRA